MNRSDLGPAPPASAVPPSTVALASGGCQRTRRGTVPPAGANRSPVAVSHELGTRSPLAASDSGVERFSARRTRCPVRVGRARPSSASALARCRRRRAPRALKPWPPSGGLVPRGAGQGWRRFFTLFDSGNLQEEEVQGANAVFWTAPPGGLKHHLAVGVMRPPPAESGLPEVRSFLDGCAESMQQALDSDVHEPTIGWGDGHRIPVAAVSGGPWGDAAEPGGAGRGRAERKRLGYRSLWTFQRRCSPPSGSQGLAPGVPVGARPDGVTRLPGPRPRSSIRPRRRGSSTTRSSRRCCSPSRAATVGRAVRRPARPGASGPAGWPRSFTGSGASMSQRGARAADDLRRPRCGALWERARGGYQGAFFSIPGGTAGPGTGAAAGSAGPDRRHVRGRRWSGPGGSVYGWVDRVKRRPVGDRGGSAQGGAGPPQRAAGRGPARDRVPWRGAGQVSRRSPRRAGSGGCSPARTSRSARTSAGWRSCGVTEVFLRT